MPLRPATTVARSLALNALCAAALGAQDSTAATAALDATGPDPLAEIAASGLRTGSWTYQSSMSRGGQSVDLARRVLTIAPATAGSEAAWLILDVTEARGQTMTDSLLVRRADLRPLSRSAQIGPLRLETRFGADSIIGSLSAPGAPSAPIAMPTGPALVANMGMLEAAFTLLPLQVGWTGTVRQLVPNPAGLTVMPLALTVTGEETVTVPAGSFPSWTVTAASGGVEQRLWLSKADGRLLKVTATPPQVPDLTYVTVLVQAPAGAP